MLSGVLEVGAGSSLVHTVLIDSSIGRDTRLVFTYAAALDVEVNVTGTNASLVVSKDDVFKLITVTVPGVMVRG